MAQKRIIATVSVPAVKNGNHYLYRLQDPDFNGVNFDFSSQKESGREKGISVIAEDNETIRVIIYNAPDNMAIVSPNMLITERSQPVYLYLSITLMETDKDDARKWVIRFSKSINR